MEEPTQQEEDSFMRQKRMGLMLRNCSHQISNSSSISMIRPQFGRCSRDDGLGFMGIVVLTRIQMSQAVVLELDNYILGL